MLQKNSESETGRIRIKESSDLVSHILEKSVCLRFKHLDSFNEKSGALSLFNF
ncbi:MAG: hypothetical protein K6E78_00420 [Treponema sp.]|nr:hypothetical protein [Treponema sp.]